jgi:SAM-dependent methyltransferase
MSTLATSAFGIEPRQSPYRLRCARYYAIGESLGQWAKTRNGSAGLPRIADVGGDEGRVYRYVEAFLGEDGFEGTLVDLFPSGTRRVFRKDRRQVVKADLEEGLPMMESNSYDVVICEQVLEHLHNAPALTAELHRILKPGGLCFMGVPSFPPGLRWIRGHVVPRVDRWRGIHRDHVHAFSLTSFCRMLTAHAPWDIVERRGFRILSGGLLRFLENYRWWWLFNRWLGSKFPSLCIEIQIVATKTQPSPEISSAPPS